MMFDVDCPQTPDGNSPKTTPSRPHYNPPRRNFANSSITAPNRKFVPRARSTSYEYYPRRNVIGGIEPEETAHVPPRTTAGVVRAPSSGPALYGRAYHAAPGYSSSNNPFDDDGRDSSNRARTHSDSWWKEEIVDESDDKGDVLDGYYGLSKKDKQEFYGKSNNPFDESTINRNGQTSFHLHKTGHVTVGIGINQDGSVESSLVDNVENTFKNQYSVNGPDIDSHAARRAATSALQLANQRNYGDSANTSVYQQAAAIRSSGQCQVDDYSFSTINIHNIPRDDIESPKRADSRTGSSLLKMPKWMEGFVPASTANYDPPVYGIPANLTRETNIAPPIRGNHQDWWSSSPKVTFDTGYQDRKSSSRWNNLTYSQKIGAGVIWVALMSTLMGVTIWSLNKPDDVTDSKRGSSSLQGFLSASVTTVPTFAPSVMTPRPTRQPFSRSPVKGNSALHEKNAFATPRPSRKPITLNPTYPPVVSPALSSRTSSPSHPLSAGATALVQAVPSSCTDNQGYYLNHLFNPKDCAWLYNDKDGYTDRKDKNCGTALYPQTELGSACPGTCALYNGCVTELPTSTASSESATYDGIAFMSGTADYLTPTQTESPTNSVQFCADKSGTFKNHLNSDKTCEWLYNEKPGQTDRKDKNCGHDQYPITELGQNCPQTCIWYNKSGCSFIQTRSVEPNLRAVDVSSTRCVNGGGKYENHHGDRKQCQWLHEEGLPEIEKFRQDRNCGTDQHPITDLGMKCPWSCREYNGCSKLRN
ncbi:hypothetical protein ACHAW6_004096 [Cyclotella cf. meneghiniana]